MERTGSKSLQENVNSCSKTKKAVLRRVRLKDMKMKEGVLTLVLKRKGK